MKPKLIQKWWIHSHSEKLQLFAYERSHRSPEWCEVDSWKFGKGLTKKRILNTMFTCLWQSTKQNLRHRTSSNCFPNHVQSEIIAKTLWFLRRIRGQNWRTWKSYSINRRKRKKNDMPGIGLLTFSAFSRAELIAGKCQLITFTFFIRKYERLLK